VRDLGFEVGCGQHAARNPGGRRVLNPEFAGDHRRCWLGRNFTCQARDPGLPLVHLAISASSSLR
jgi:hypothetical protein